MPQGGRRIRTARRVCRAGLYAIVLALLLLCSVAFAANDSGVKPTSISLPSGPGSIDGLGDSFSPTLNSGTTTYQVTLELPPGRAGLAPDLALRYSGGAGQGVFGLSWELNVPYVQRQVEKGLPRYTMWPNGDGLDNDHDGVVDEYDEFDGIIYSNKEELIPVETGYWRLENDSEFIRFAKLETGWRAERPDGVTMEFGTTPESRIESNGRVFRWMLSRMEDKNGNEILYFYSALDASAQRYLERIRYNHLEGRYTEVTLMYELRPDTVIDYRPRFELKTAFRCARLDVYALNEPVRRYELTYEGTTETQPLSLLRSIRELGSDLVSSLPEATFGYTQFDPSGTDVRVMSSAPAVDFDSSNVDLSDVNGDGLPDVLDTGQQPNVYYLNLGAGPNGEVTWGPARQMNNSVGLYLGASTTTLADITGDGRSDLIDMSGQTVAVYSVDDAAWQAQAPVTGAAFSFSDPSVKLQDIDHDKRIDVIQTAGSAIYGWVSMSTGRYSQRFTGILPDPQLQLDRTTTKRADMNGDGLLDLVYVESGSMYYFPSMGPAEFGARVMAVNPPTGLTDPTRVLVGDLNGDGLADLAYVGNRLSIWVNQGLSVTDHSQFEFSSEISIESPLLNSFVSHRHADVNGSGSADIVWNTSANGPMQMAFVDLTGEARPYLLEEITNGIGRKTTITYRSSVADMIMAAAEGNEWTTMLPFPVPVVAAVAEGDGRNAYLTEFRYYDGYYDGADKEFRGFGRVVKTEVGDESAPSLVSTFRFDTGLVHEALKGQLLELETRSDAGDLYFRERYDWQPLAVDTSVAQDERLVRFAAEYERVREIFETESVPILLRWQFDYDLYGNRTHAFEEGRLGDEWNDERIIQTTYSAGFDSGQDEWILDRVIETAVSDETGERAAHIRNYYDQNDSLGAVSRGNVSRIDAWVQGETWTTTERRDHDQFGNTTAIFDGLYGVEAGHARRILYDEAQALYPIEERLATGDPTLPEIVLAASYDAGLGVVKTFTDANGGMTLFGHDVFGRLVAVVRPGDSLLFPTESFSYTLREELPDGSFVNWIDSQRREHASGGTVDSRTFYDGFGRVMMKRSESELVGRVVVTDAALFNRRQAVHRRYLPYFDSGGLSYSVPPPDATFANLEYDPLLREVRRVQPDGTWSEIRYEPLRRIEFDESQTDSSSVHSGASTVTIYDGLRLEDGSYRVAAKQERVKLTDSGSVTPSPSLWTTHYSHDVLNNFTGYTDAQRNSKSIRYDGFSRRVVENDPDRGISRLYYDAASNLIRTVDAKGQTVQYEYDGANRIKREYRSADSRSPDVEYFYDVSFGPVEHGNLWPGDGVSGILDRLLGGVSTGVATDRNQDGVVDVADIVRASRQAGETYSTAANTIGELAWVRDESGEEHYSYDLRGRRVWTISRIRDELGDMHAFYMASNYDSMDRMTRRTFPDGSYLDIDYNRRGLLESTSSSVRNIDYNAAGQRTEVALSNGVSSTFTYDERLRLMGVTASRSNSDPSILQNLALRYDNTINVVGIMDQRSNDLLAALGRELDLSSSDVSRLSHSQSLTYDDAYRLIGAAGLGGAEALSYRYDRIGNQVFKAATGAESGDFAQLGVMQYGGAAGSSGRSGRATGDPPGPHALTATNSETMSPSVIEYDANGNVVSERGQLYEWDHRDRLVSAVDGTATAVYTYDYLDRRRLKAGTTGERVLYVSEHAEVRDGELLKYVYVGPNRVVRADGVDLGTLTPERFFLHDHVGSTQVATDQNGVVIGETAYYPFGIERFSAHRTDDVYYRHFGRERDLGTHLRNHGSRYLGVYGRFMSVDAVYAESNLEETQLGPQDLNLYTYSGNNPLSVVDVRGELVWLPAVYLAVKAYDVYSTASDARQLYQHYKQGDAEKMRAKGASMVVGIAAGSIGKRIYKGVGRVLDSKIARRFRGDVQKHMIKTAKKQLRNLQKNYRETPGEHIGVNTRQWKMIGEQKEKIKALKSADVDRVQKVTSETAGRLVGSGSGAVTEHQMTKPEPAATPSPSP